MGNNCAERITSVDYPYLSSYGSVYDTFYSIHAILFPMPTPQTLDDVRTALYAFKGIEIAKNANPVMGHGNPHAKIVFVGEAPGEQEDQQGIPFVGRAGTYLNELLATIGLNREDTYITNIVKFRPPDNRDPTEEEKAACLPFLEQELSIIEPQVIVPLGRHALSFFLPHVSIGDVHGIPQIINHRTIVPMYHPAAAMYNPKLRPVLADDFKKLGAFLKERA